MYKHTESGIKAFEDFYGLINHDTSRMLLGNRLPYNRETYKLEKAVLGCTLRQHHIKQIKEKNI